MYLYLVLNNEFNRNHYPSLIGQRFVNPPTGARTRKLKLRAYRKLTVREDGGEVEQQGPGAEYSAC